MKKKMAAIVMAATMVMMTAIPTMASVNSPSNKPVTATPAPVAPKTGESDALLYGVGAAAVCGTVIVITGKKLKKA